MQATPELWETEGNGYPKDQDTRFIFPAFYLGPTEDYMKARNISIKPREEITSR